MAVVVIDPERGPKLCTTTLSNKYDEIWLVVNCSRKHVLEEQEKVLPEDLWKVGVPWQITTKITETAVRYYNLTKDYPKFHGIIYKFTPEGMIDNSFVQPFVNDEGDYSLTVDSAFLAYYVKPCIGDLKNTLSGLHAKHVESLK